MEVFKKLVNKFTNTNKTNKMEALKIEKGSYVYHSYELATRVKEVLDRTKEWAKDNDYQIIGDLDLSELSSVITGMSKTGKKKINKKVVGLALYPSIRRANLFCNYIAKHVLKLDSNPMKFDVPVKEAEIKKARKEWVKYRDLAQAALVTYKAEKGDYYKK